MNIKSGINVFTKIQSRVLYLAMLLSILLIVSCVTYVSTISKRNVAYIYSPASSTIHPKLLLTHKDDSTSLLLVRFNTGELLFNQANPTQRFKAQIKIRYDVFPSFESMQLIDTGSVRYLIDGADMNREYTSFIFLRLPFGNKYLIQVQVFDILRERSSKAYLSVDKTSFDNRFSYNIISRKTKGIVFNSYVNSTDTIEVHNYTQNPKFLYVSFSGKEFPLPPPPFSSKIIEPLVITPERTLQFAYNDSLGFNLNKRGLYHFMSDSVNTTGITLYHFDDYFPELKTAEQLIRPLQYLTSSEEFYNLRNSKEKKVALDNFWLKATGNVSAAKDLIRIFYHRVTLANIYFTAHTEGWRTDRGMIYIVFGPPETLYKTEKLETWIYGDNRNLKTISFVFEKSDNPYSDNYYILQRNPSYKDNWHQSVESWRKGAVYSY